ncbi:MULTISPECIES: GGDEF domain-containing protein [unclassified Francisella]|uniref:GGDEF domain-containing protein n=1 Tax=unclassified Francisella TaxID=2610885 RepID=UPI002E36E8CD|nr:MULTISPECIES: GGDEF domain-containing protein [unclassified Francisella]MED7820112.1 GGDEF domain-containing protein [Francisella sp. 19S2-4]MED7830932.1 GGDEF domain-containing protein [Francisella sp. 19S2-10]
MYLPQRKSHTISSLIVFILSCTVIFGWLTQNISVIKIAPNFPPMQFNTALCFGILAIVNFIPKTSKFSYSRCILSLVVLIISLLTLLEYLFGLNFSIDQITNTQTLDQSLYPGRMSPNTAVCFVLLAIANILPRFKKNILLFKGIFLSIQLIVFLLAYIALIGYFFDISFYFSWGYITGMAIHTATCFLLLTIFRVSFIITKSKTHTIGIILSATTFIVFFLFWLYTFDQDSNAIKNKIFREISLVNANLEKKLNLEATAIERLYKRLSTSSYSDRKAIRADMQAYENDYPNIYFIYYAKDQNNPIFISNYDINKNQAIKVLKECDSNITSSKAKIICIREQNNKFNVVFKPNFSEEVMSEINPNKYNIEVYLENYKVYSNLNPKQYYGMVLSYNFSGEKNWHIKVFMTDKEFEQLQMTFPSVFFLLGIVISLMVQSLFYFISINYRKNKILEQKQIKLEKFNTIDSLTGCLNRHTIEKKLKTILNSNIDSDKNIAILFIDLDNFKYINDKYGHKAGDLVLKETAYRFEKDIRKDDLVSRIGGDEFIIILRDINNKQEAIDIINRIFCSFREKISISKEIEITQALSIGATLISKEHKGISSDKLITKADLAMYNAKKSGRNNFSFSD